MALPTCSAAPLEVMTWRMFESDGYTASASSATRTRTTTSSTAVTPAWPVPFDRVHVVSFMASPALSAPGDSTTRHQLVRALGERGHPVAAGPLRLVEGLVGGPHDLVRVPAVPGERRQPDAHRDRVHAVGPQDARLHPPPEPLGEHEAVGLPRLGQEERELLAADPAGHVALSRGRAHERAERAEHPVPLRVAELV